MKASEVMTVDVVTTSPCASLGSAADLMREHEITSLPVLDEEERIVGIVSESDLLRARIVDPGSRVVRDVMSDAVLCVGENAEIAQVAAVMLDNGVRAVPIADGSRLVGIVSRRDLLRTLVRDDVVIAAEIRERLVAYAGPAQTWSAEVHEGAVVVRGRFASAGQRHVVEVLVRSVPGVISVQFRQ